MAQTRETYHFIHNVFGHFFKDMLDYFSTTLYPRFEYRVVGTYDKAVEYLAKRSQYDRETDQPILPALVLNPSGEFSPADANAGGKQLWRYPNLAPTMIKRLFNPVYQDDNLIMHAGFIRIKGEFELIMLLNSFYEYCDLRLLLINYFGGLDRIIYPRFFSSFIILPDSFLSYEYTNEYTGLHYDIDWSTSNASNQLVRSTARNEVVLPLNIKPQISLVSMADASNRYGGPDKIAEWRLTATINYEIEMPNYMVLESDYLAENVHLEMRYGSAFSLYNDYQPPVNRQIINYHWDWGLDETSNSNITYLSASDTTCETDYVGDYVYKTRYFHEVTEADAAEDPYLDIDLPETVTDKLVLIVNSKHGELNFGDHYIFIDNGSTLRIKMENVTLEAGWFLELYFYEDITSSSSSSSSVSSSSSSSSSSISSSSESSSSESSSSESSSSSSVSASWVAIFSNGNWQPWDEADVGPGSWDLINQEWDSQNGGVYEYIALEAIGDWWVGLKDYPKNTSKIRVSHDPEATLSALIFYDDTSVSWVDPFFQWESSVTSGQEITINWSELDLKYLVFRGLFNTGVPFSVTNIEFFTGVSISSSSTSVSSSSVSSSSVSLYWTSAFDNTKWQPWTNANVGPGTWDNESQKWDSETLATFEFVALDATGGWNLDIKDKVIKIRITHDSTSSLGLLYLYNNAASDWFSPTIHSELDVVSGEEITISWNGADLEYIVMRNQSGHGPFSITNIEFFGEL